MKVLDICVNGHTGYRAVELLTDRQHPSIPMTREPDRRELFGALGVPCAFGDLAYPIDHAVRGCEAVLFAAGLGSQSGRDKTVTVDDLGAIRVAVAAPTRGVKRFDPGV